jgi:hypothetical protein
MIKNISKKINKGKNGYTIIETMIAVSLFIVIVMAGMGALLNANLLHQKSSDMRSIIDNLSFIMEDMGRNLRTGYDYRCITSESSADLSGANVVIAKSGQTCLGIAFEPATGDPNNPNDQWVYLIDSGKIWKRTVGPYDVFNPPYIQLTSDAVVINMSASNFSVLGAESPSAGDAQQPFVTIRLVGTITSKSIVTPFSLQTSVSQRLIDI